MQDLRRKLGPVGASHVRTIRGVGLIFWNPNVSDESDRTAKRPLYFGDLTLERRNYLLLRKNGEIEPLSRGKRAALTLLAQTPRKVFTYLQIAQAIKGDGDVDEKYARTAVSSQIVGLRRVIGHDSIENFHKRGYRLNP